jgi:hypothetical protein
MSALDTPSNSATISRRNSLVAGIALSSFSALLLELALTRLFSVVLFYHFAFLAISIALLGLGAGGVFAYLWKAWLTRFDTRSLVATLCRINAIVVILILLVVLRVPVSLDLTGDNFLRLTIIYLASAVPFFLTGLEFSIVFAREAANIPNLYGADLGGGALACLAVVPLLNLLGGPNTVLFAGVMAALAAAVWAADGRRRRSSLRMAAVIAGLIALNYSGRILDVVYAKGKVRDKAWVEFARWNAISRVEVDRQGDAKAVVIDADASTFIMSADPAIWQNPAWREKQLSVAPALPNVLRPNGDYAIIGPGGGPDVLRALVAGSPSVTAIEINPIIANTIMRGRYADYSHHLYERPDVHIHVTDGRSYLRNTKERFDVIQMTLVDTWASTAAGAFALSENSLYSVNAFREYFEHLKPDGMIAITRWEFQQPREALRVVSVAMEALHQLGVANPQKNLMAVSEGDLDEDGIPVVVLAKRSAFTAQEEQTIQAHLDKHPILSPLYLPSYAEASPQKHSTSEAGPQSFADLIASNDPRAFAANYPYDVSPVTDNAPFFFFTLKTSQLLNPGSLAEGIDWKVNLGVVVLGMVFLISIIAVLAFLIIPMAWRSRGGRQRALPLLYFIAVGLGYILVEIAFIQRFVLFLGHPTYALTVVVFLMLLSSGAGSLMSRKWLKQTESGWRPLVVAAGLVFLYVFVLPGTLNALIGLSLVAKLLVSALLLVPLGFAMGMPFPTGLRALASMPAPEFPAGKAAGESAVEWAWAMNAASSVLGSVLAMVIAIHFGLSITLACGAFAYLLALLLTPTLSPRM